MDGRDPTDNSSSLAIDNYLIGLVGWLAGWLVGYHQSSNWENGTGILLEAEELEMHSIRIYHALLDVVAPTMQTNSQSTVGQTTPSLCVALMR